MDSARGVTPGRLVMIPTEYGTGFILQSEAGQPVAIVVPGGQDEANARQLVTLWNVAEARTPVPGETGFILVGLVKCPHCGRLRDIDLRQEAADAGVCTAFYHCCPCLSATINLEDFHATPDA